MESTDENSSRSFRILTVGDGDLSFSLALKRAYPNASVTASTLVDTPTELIRTYSNAAAIRNEFCNVWKETIVYRVDATRLKDCLEFTTPTEPKFDVVLFNHPHLGDATLRRMDEQHHAQRHYVLLCHYFHSAKSVLYPQSAAGGGGGRIHVCLCGTQPTTWNVMEAARQNGLRCVSQEGTTSPVHKWLFPSDGGCGEGEDEIMTPAAVQKHYPSKRKYRNGKLGSKHFLGKYGYSHRRTGGDLYGGTMSDMVVHQSINFLFAPEEDSTEVPDKVDPFQCKICKLSFSNESELQQHLKAPAMPDIMTDDFLYSKGDVPSSSTIPPRENPTTYIQDRKDGSEGLELNEESILIQATVQKCHDGKRMKWLCRQSGFPLAKKSKKQCEDIIKSGRVFVNGSKAMDDSRILRENDVISLVPSSDQTSQMITKSEINHHGVRILLNREINGCNMNFTPTHLIVAEKPVGIRVVGSFATNTLEMIVQSMLNSKLMSNEVLHCSALSKLETGCAGLCVLTSSPLFVSQRGKHPDFRITYIFSCLVHGVVADEWREGIYVKVPSSGPRHWKRKKKVDSSADLTETSNNDENEDEDDDSVTCFDGCKMEATSSSLDLKESIFIKCMDSFCTSSVSLSTLEIRSEYDSGRLTNFISFLLRKLGYPVVNDRFCKREFAGLPRIMRNSLKQKICICCNGLDIKLTGGKDDSSNYVMDETISIAPNRRTQCAHWRSIMRNAGEV